MFGLPPEFTGEFMARLEQLRVKTRRESTGSGKGSHLSPKRGSSLEFSDYRHYVAGDDFRYIDWGLYGRTDKFYVKLFKEEADLLTSIFLDASASMAVPPADRKFQSAINVALALAYVALSAGDRVVVRVLAGGGKAAAPAFVHGRHRITELARQLAAIKPAGTLDLPDMLARELSSLRRAGKAFVVSDFQMTLDGATKGMGLFLASEMDATAVQILGGAEMEAAGLQGDFEVVDAETGERLRVALGRRERALVRETQLLHAREIRSSCLKRGLHYALYTTERDFHDFFLRAVSELGLVH